MYKYLAKNGQLLAFGLGAIITFAFLAIVFSGLEGFEALDKEAKGTTGIFDLGLVAVIILMIFSFVAAIVAGIYQTATNPKGSIYGIAGVVALIAIYFISQAIGSNDAPIMDTIEEFNVTPGQSAFITGGISTTIVLLVVVVLAFVFSEVRNFFK